MFSHLNVVGAKNKVNEALDSGWHFIKWVEQAKTTDEPKNDTHVEELKLS